jgi:hypothetical protein
VPRDDNDTIDDKPMPLIEHLMELRTRLLWSVGAFIIAFAVRHDAHVLSNDRYLNNIPELARAAGVSASSVRLGQGSVLIDTGTGLNIHLEDVDFNDVLGGPRTLDLITFADGTVWRYEDLIARGFDLEGSAQSDTLRGSNVVDRIVAGVAQAVHSVLPH